MNWGEIPVEMTDGAAQLRKAQENIKKLVDEEINRRVHYHCLNWRMKMARVLRERETLREHLEQGNPDIALTLIRHNDAGWFRNTSPKEHIKKLEDSYLDSRPPA